VNEHTQAFTAFPGSGEGLFSSAAPSFHHIPSFRAFIIHYKILFYSSVSAAQA
jgi:hypothetical protein